MSILTLPSLSLMTAGFQLLVPRRIGMPFGVVVSIVFVAIPLLLGCSPASNADKLGNNNSTSANEDRSKSASDGRQDQDGARSGKNSSIDEQKEQRGGVAGPVEGNADGKPMADAKSFVQSCIDRYAKLESYEDSAVAKLYIPTVPQIDESGPARIAFERPNRLAMRMGQLKSMSQSGLFESIVGEGENRPFENQRVVRPLPEKISLDWLLLDHLYNPLETRIFNTPVPLQLLLGASQLQDIVNGGAQCTFLTPEKIESLECERIQIKLKNWSWTLWIDEPTKLIRRIELPIESIDGTTIRIPENIDRSKIVFRVDLNGVKINQSIDWTQWSFPREKDQVLVRRFSEPPPRNLPVKLGKQVSAMSLKDPAGTEAFDTRARKRPVTVLHWIDDEMSSKAYVEEVMRFNRLLGDAGLEISCENILITTVDAKKIQVALKSWDCNLPTAIDVDGELTRQCGVQHYPTCIILDSNCVIQSFDEVPNFALYIDRLREVRDKVDLAARYIKTALDDEERYASRLHRSILDKEQVSKLGELQREIDTFPFTYCQMERENVAKFDEPIMAAAGELFYTAKEMSSGERLTASEIYAKKTNSYRVMSVLDDTGTLWTVDQSGRKMKAATIRADQIDQAKRIHVLPDPWNHNSIAIVPEGKPRFWIATVPSVYSEKWSSVEAMQIPLNSDDDSESAISAVWTYWQGKTQLAIVTNRNRLHLLNPLDQKKAVLKAGDVGEKEMRLVVPQLASTGECTGWNMVWSDGSVVSMDSMGAPDEQDLKAKLQFKPLGSSWLWGVTKNEAYMMALAELESGETGAATMASGYQFVFRQALSVRPEQCKLLSGTTSENGSFLWLGTAPNRVLHLQSIGGAVADQMSFGERVFGGAIIPNGDKLEMVIALEKEVSLWKVSLPPQLK